MGKDLKGKELGKGIVQRPDKRYYARFTGKGGKQIGKYFTNLADAKVWLRDSIYDDAHGGNYASTDVTVNDWFEEWLKEAIAPRVKYNTRVSYQGRYNNRIKPIIGDMPLISVRPIHCQKVLNYCMDNEDSTGSMAKIRSIMHKMFEYARENDMIKTDPVTSNVKYLKKPKKEKRVFTIAEQNRFLELAKESSYYNVFRFILETGLRIGELAALKWDDCDKEIKNITVKNTLYLNTETHQFEENSAKTEKGIRNIRLTKVAHNIILERQVSKRPDLPYIFYNGNGSPIKEGDVNKALQRIVKGKMGIEGFTPHSLRHTFATRCVERGVKPKALQKLMGHASISTTLDIYVHATEDEMVNEMSKFGELA